MSIASITYVILNSYAPYFTLNWSAVRRELRNVNLTGSSVQAYFNLLHNYNDNFTFLPDLSIGNMHANIYRGTFGSDWED